MGDRSYSYQLFHSLHVFSLLFILLYFFLSLSCPYCHSVIILSCHDTSAFAPPASVHPSLDNLSSTLLASLPFQRRSLLPSPRPSFFNSYRASLLIYLSLLLSGDIQLNPGPSTSNLISFATLNIRSASVVTSELDKPAVLHDFILDNSLDIVLLTETWLSNDVPLAYLILSLLQIFLYFTSLVLQEGVAVLLSYTVLILKSLKFLLLPLHPLNHFASNYLFPAKPSTFFLSTAPHLVLYLLFLKNSLICLLFFALNLLN